MNSISKQFSKMVRPIKSVNKQFQHKIWGPLLVTLLTFIAGGSIQLIGFGQAKILPNFAPELSLWSTGILFALSLLQDTKSLEKSRRSISRKSSSYEVKINLTSAQSVGFDTRYLYALVLTMMIWLLTTVINGQCARILEESNRIGTGIIVLNVIGCLLAGISVGVALYFLVNDLQESVEL